MMVSEIYYVRRSVSYSIYNTLQNAQYLRAGELSRFLTFIFMILSRIPIYQAQKRS